MQSASWDSTTRCAAADLLIAKAGASSGWRSERRRALGLMVSGAAAVLAPSTRGPSAHPTDDLPGLVAALKPSVFPIGTFARLQTPTFRFAGSCFAIAGDRFVTCAHVIQPLEPANREIVAIALPDGHGIRVIELRVLAMSRETDLAVLEPVVALRPSTRPLPIASTLPAEGSDIVLIGYPIGGALGLVASTHRGLIASIVPLAIPLPTPVGLEARNIQMLRSGPIDILQLDATAYPGNSGGPVVEVRSGQVVGVVSLAMVKRTRESAISFPSGISYAVPAIHLPALLASQ